MKTNPITNKTEEKCSHNLKTKDDVINFIKNFGKNTKHEFFVGTEADYKLYRRAFDILKDIDNPNYRTFKEIRKAFIRLVDDESNVDKVDLTKVINADGTINKAFIKDPTKHNAIIKVMNGYFKWTAVVLNDQFYWNDTTKKITEAQKKVLRDEFGQEASFIDRLSASPKTIDVNTANGLMQHILFNINELEDKVDSKPRIIGDTQKVNEVMSKIFKEVIFDDEQIKVKGKNEK